MTYAIEKCLQPLRMMNVRVLIGGGVLGVIVVGEAMVAYAS